MSKVIEGIWKLISANENLGDDNFFDEKNETILFCDGFATLSYFEEDSDNIAIVSFSKFMESHQTVLCAYKELCITIDQFLKENNIEIKFAEDYFVGYDKEGNGDVFYGDAANLEYFKYACKDIMCDLLESSKMTEYLENLDTEKMYSC